MAPILKKGETSWRRKVLPRLAAGAVFLVFSFLLFDRLLYYALRAGADYFYSSVAASAFEVKKGLGRKGDGNALLLGSSRAYSAFDPKTLSERLNKHVFREAQAGKFPKFNYFFYRKFQQKMGPPTLVFYGLDYFMFVKKTAPLSMARLDKAIRLTTLEPRGAVNEASPLLSRVSWLFRLKPDIDEYAANILGLDRESGPEAETDEDEPKKAELYAGGGLAPVPARQGPVAARPVRWRRRAYRPYPGIEGSYLKALLDYLEKDDVWTFLIIIPDHEATNSVNFEPLKFRRDMEKLAARYTKVRVLDFNTPEKFDLADPTLFRESGWGVSNCHLSVKGRLDFSRKLAVEVNRILREDGTRRSAGKRIS
jgi:hypothetical protein